MRHCTLTDVLLDRAKSTRAVNLIGGHNQRERLAYCDLLERAQLRLVQFQSLGMRPGDHVIILCADIGQFLEGFWACLLGGITAVPVAGGNSAEHRLKLFRIAEKLQRPGLLTDARTRQRLSEFAQSNSAIEAFESLNTRCVLCDESAQSHVAGKQAVIASPGENDTAFIQFSSGSTSTPKGVVLTHKNLLTNLRAIIVACQMTDEDHQLSWMPLTHDMGLIGFHLVSVLKDNDHSLMPTELFVRRPGLWLSESASVGATMLCSPNFGYQHLLKSFKPEKHDGLDLSRVRLVFNGAEPISEVLCHRFMDSLAPFKLSRRAMFPVYGLAEASLAVSFPSLDTQSESLVATLSIDRTCLGVGQSIQLLPDAAANRAVTFVSVGVPVPDVQLQIADSDGNELAEGVTGHIRILGDNVTGGYYAEPQLNAVTISADGWLDTGDLGFIHEGQLYITGRAKDIIFVSGQNVYPHDLEEIILQAGLAERGKLAVSSQPSPQTGEEHLLVFLLHRSEAAELEDKARGIVRLLSTAAGLAVHAVVAVPRIPKTTSGKVQRYLLVESYGDDEFDVITTAAPERENLFKWSDEFDAASGLSAATNETFELADADGDIGAAETATRLLSICNAQVTELQVRPDDNLFDLGISSLTLAQIHAGIEEAWPDQVDITDLFDYPTVTELAAFLDQQNAA